MSFYKTIIKIIFFLSLIVVIIESSLLFYYQYFSDAYNSNPYESAILVEGYNNPYIYIHLFKNDDLYKQNNYNMRRGQNITEKPAKNVTRILSYGDSIGLGDRVPEKYTYNNFLEKKLNESSRSAYEVLNMSRGYAPSIYAMNIKQNIDQFEPKRIIVEIELFNDLSDEVMIEYDGYDSDNLPKNITRGRYWPGWQTMPPISDRAYPWETLRIRKFSLDITRKIGFLRQKYFPNPIYQEGSDVYFYALGYDNYYITEQRVNLAFDRMFKLLKAMQMYSNAQGVDFLLVILPTRYYYPNPAIQNLYQKGAIQWYDKAINRASELEIPNIGLAHDIQEGGGKTLFLDFCHPSDVGHYYIAHAIYTYYQHYYDI